MAARHKLPEGMRLTKRRQRMSAAQLQEEIKLWHSRKNATNFPEIEVEEEPQIQETDAEVAARIADRFDILADLTKATITGEARAVIVSGPAGLGKSYTVEETVKDWDPNKQNHAIVKGFVKATGLYKLLYQYRHKGQVIVFDDADSIFYDDNSLNLLKASCDTNEERVISYLSEGILIDEESAERIPRSFEFEGSIVFISNVDFDAMIAKGHKLAPHMEAMVSRAHYIDLAMKTKRDYLIRIKQVIGQGLLRSKGYTAEMEKDVVKFIDDNSDKLRELSLRIALKIAALRKSNPAKWQKTARVTCCKN